MEMVLAAALGSLAKKSRFLAGAADSEELRRALLGAAEYYDAEVKRLAEQRTQIGRASVRG